MSSFLYLTADRVGLQTGGGLVTQQELQALQEFAGSQTVDVIDRGVFGDSFPSEPFAQDELFFQEILKRANPNHYREELQLVHCYSGCLSKTVAKLKEFGCRVSYTIAAHDKEISRREHEKLGLPFNLPHLTEESLWQWYIEGYRLADKIICPSMVAENTVRKYGEDFEYKSIEVIPHGCHVPEKAKPLPQGLFVVGYLGSFGCDKGIRYLLEAWKKLNYKDAMLRLAGKESVSDFAFALVNQFGGGCIHLAGWQRDVSDFYNGIHLYIQSSATEGFGLEVLEAMAHERAVLCSRGAGASGLLDGRFVYAPYDDVDTLAECIDNARKTWSFDGVGFQNRIMSASYSWDRIRDRYKDVWRRML